MDCSDGPLPHGGIADRRPAATGTRSVLHRRAVYVRRHCHSRGSSRRIRKQGCHHRSLAVFSQRRRTAQRCIGPSGRTAVAGKKEYDHSSGICAYPANHRFRIGILEQHTGSRGFHPDHQAMGLQNWPAAPQIPYSALLCCDSGRYVYAYRHIDQPGGPRHDARSGPRGFHDVRTGQGRNIHSHRGYALHDLFRRETPARRERSERRRTSGPQ